MNPALPLSLFALCYICAGVWKHFAAVTEGGSDGLRLNAGDCNRPDDLQATPELSDLSHGNDISESAVEAAWEHASENSRPGVERRTRTDVTAGETANPFLQRRGV